MAIFLYNRHVAGSQAQSAAKKSLVPRKGLEPPQPYDRQHLKLVRLPISPPGHASIIGG